MFWTVCAGRFRALEDTAGVCGSGSVSVSVAEERGPDSWRRPGVCSRVVNGEPERSCPSCGSEMLVPWLACELVTSSCVLTEIWPLGHRHRSPQRLSNWGLVLPPAVPSTSHGDGDGRTLRVCVTRVICGLARLNLFPRAVNTPTPGSPRRTLSTSDCTWPYNHLGEESPGQIYKEPPTQDLETCERRIRNCSATPTAIPHNKFNCFNHHGLLVFLWANRCTDFK